MIRLAMLAAAGTIIFGGFSLPFFIEGTHGLWSGALTVFLGAMIFWFVELRTRKLLDKDSALNTVLKADGENLIERE